MQTLAVRGIPDDLWERLSRAAAAERVSPEEAVVRILSLALGGARENCDGLLDVLEELDRVRWTPPLGTPASTEWLREDRGR